MAKKRGMVVGEMLWYAPSYIVVFHLLKTQKAQLFQFKKEKGPTVSIARVLSPAKKKKKYWFFRALLAPVAHNHEMRIYKPDSRSPSNAKVLVEGEHKETTKDGIRS